MKHVLQTENTRQIITYMFLTGTTIAFVFYIYDLFFLVIDYLLLETNCRNPNFVEELFTN